MKKAEENQWEVLSWIHQTALHSLERDPRSTFSVVLQKNHSPEDPSGVMLVVEAGAAGGVVEGSVSSFQENGWSAPVHGKRGRRRTALFGRITATTSAI